MNGLGEILFGPVGSSLSIVALGLKILGALIMCAALALLARRSELGWWLAIGSFAMSLLAGTFAVPVDFLSSAAIVTLYIVGSWIPPLVGAAVSVYGLLWFRKAPETQPLTRDVSLRRFTPDTLVPPLLVAVIFAAANLIPVLILNASGSGPNLQIPLTPMFVSGFLGGFLAAGLLGLANRSRWAWFLIAAAALVSIAGTTLAAQGSVLIFIYLAQAVLAVYGWGRWGGIPERSTRR
ncbi:nicotinamide mononucleotide transporter [Arthrobacter sp. GMC3]|uniref:nicotinamide mononucleotide transporter n=1 Tax=Arthrobacter sp. GMC3 TaxID=2058894 RepID=UPI000CE57143|nr:nicotinamide mononucleotide transporter [Arthrobacter sp. GMC3]